jgi:hypothetical protein
MNCCKLKPKQISLYCKIENIMPLKSCKVKRRNTDKISEKFSRRNHRRRRNFDKIPKFQLKLWILINCKKRSQAENNKFKSKKVLETNPKTIDQVKNHHKKMKKPITKSLKLKVKNKQNQMPTKNLKFRIRKSMRPQRKRSNKFKIRV